MRLIVTHQFRNLTEIMEVLIKSGSFTAPLGLPHYRYDGTRRNCHILEAAKLIKRSGKTDFHVHFVPGANYNRWVEAGKPAVKDFCNTIIKEHKAANPPKPKARICRGCGIRFETIHPKQKSCKRGCKGVVQEVAHG